MRVEGTAGVARRTMAHVPGGGLQQATVATLKYAP